MGHVSTPAKGVGGAWDFGAYDTTHTNEFANPDRFADGPDDSVHAVCPYDQYDELLESEHYALFGTPGGDRIAGTDCRSAARDISGTVAGWWFPESSKTGVANGFAIGTELDGQVRMGGPGWSLSVRTVDPTWRDPTTITSNHCYAANGWYALLELRDPETLLVDHGVGACPISSSPTSGLFVR